jgi:polyphosphate glucokinase
MSKVDVSHKSGKTPKMAKKQTGSNVAETDQQPQTPTKKPVVLAIDIGGSHVKIMLSNDATERNAVSGPGMTAALMVSCVQELTKGLTYDVIAMGYPGPVAHGKIIAEPQNLGKGWIAFDFAAAFGKPTKIVNDALMQAVGSYHGGRMLFLGLGTGLGAAMMVENVGEPMELAHLPYKKGRSYEDYVGEASLKERGRSKWEKHVKAVVEIFSHALEPDYVVIGGGNVEKIKNLPPHCERGDNTNAFKGGFLLWNDDTLKV